MDLISRRNFIETVLIINSSIAEMLAIKQTKMAAAYNPDTIYRNGKVNKANPVSLLA